MSLSAGPKREQPSDHEAEVDDRLSEIMELVQRRMGVDLRCYRQSTVARRMANRLRLAGCRDHSEYLDLLARQPEEAERLVEYVTIKWSRFFRDGRVFDRLRGEILPRLAAGAEGELAIWSAGCGRGEEPYSLAILLQEMGSEGRAPRAAIYGTDVDESALAAAAARLYPQSELAEMPPHLVESYFTPQPSRLTCLFRLRDEVGKEVRFLRHDLLSAQSPPEGRSFHLVLCRNVLIYFDKRVQGRAIDLLSCSLHPGGYLCLGEAEQLPVEYSGVFETVDRRDRVYRKRTSAKGR